MRICGTGKCRCLFQERLMPCDQNRLFQPQVLRTPKLVLELALRSLHGHLTVAPTVRGPSCASLRFSSSFGLARSPLLLGTINISTYRWFWVSWIPLIGTALAIIEASPLEHNIDHHEECQHVITCIVLAFKLALVLFASQLQREL